MSDGNLQFGVKPTRPSEVTLEAWSQGFMVGALIIMAAITLANMRRGVLLHKLILIEVRCSSYTPSPAGNEFSLIFYFILLIF